MIELVLFRHRMFHSRLEFVNEPKSFQMVKNSFDVDFKNT